MNNIEIYNSFKILDTEIKKQIQENNKAYFNLGVKGGIFMCLEMIAELEKVENNNIIEKLKTNLENLINE